MTESAPFEPSSFKLVWLGWVIVCVGAVLWCIALFGMDTAVHVRSEVTFLPERIENIGLIAKRQITVDVGSTLVLVGTVMAAIGHVGNLLERLITKGG